jgi:hypothetical protein
MKNLTSLALLTLAIVAPTATFADTNAQRGTLPAAAGDTLIDPRALGDDICWVAPEWRDS